MLLSKATSIIFVWRTKANSPGKQLSPPLSVPPEAVPRAGGIVFFSRAVSQGCGIRAGYFTGFSETEEGAKHDILAEKKVSHA